GAPCASLIYVQPPEDPRVVGRQQRLVRAVVETPLATLAQFGGGGEVGVFGQAGGLQHHGRQEGDVERGITRQRRPGEVALDHVVGEEIALRLQRGRQRALERADQAVE